MAAPKKGVAFTVGLNLYTKTSQLVNQPSTLTAQTSKDFGAYQAVSSVSIVSTTYGQIKVVLDSTQMNGDVVGLYVRDESTETVPFTATIYTSSNTLNDLATAVSTGFAAQTSALSTMATSIGLRATSTEVSSGFAAQTAILSTMAAALSSVTVTVPSTQIAAAVWNSSRTDYAVAGTFGEVETSTDVAAAVWADPGSTALTAALSTMATSIGLRATSTEVSSGFAAQTAVLSTMAAAVSSIAVGSTLTANEVRDAVFAYTLDSTNSFAQVTRASGRVLLGLVSGSSGSTTVFRDLADSKNAITAVTDSNGNRTSVTVDWS